MTSPTTRMTHLPGSHRTRVFVGGSYSPENERILKGLQQAVARARFVPIVANDFRLIQPDRDIHDVTLWLLHGCRLAVFEVSTLSGALMELERLPDYGVRRALLLYHHPGGRRWPTNRSAWRTTRMLQSLALEHGDRLSVRPYARPYDAFRETRNFLRAVRRSAYGKLHSL